MLPVHSYRLAKMAENTCSSDKRPVTGKMHIIHVYCPGIQGSFNGYVVECLDVRNL